MATSSKKSKAKNLQSAPAASTSRPKSAKQGKAGQLTEDEWRVLTYSIKLGKCTPFLGAGASAGVLKTGSEIAETWAKEYDYPLADRTNLISVSQFLAVKFDPMFAKYKIVEMFADRAAPKFSDPLEPHMFLGSLPLPIYITTNYDDFMVQGLKRQPLPRDPQKVLCRWNLAVKNLVRDEPNYIELKPDSPLSIARPVVFHLHGYVPVAESLVLTEDDYMDFLVNMASDDELIPPQIAKALTGTIKLFLGYRIADWNFRVLLRSFERVMERAISRPSIAVMMLPDPAEGTREEAQAYLTKYYKNIDVRVYWGKVSEFISELKNRLDGKPGS